MITTPPPDWRATTVRRVLRPLDRPARSGLGVITAYRDGTVTLRANRRKDGYTFSDTENGYQEIRPGDLVFHALDGFAGAVGVSDSHGNGSPVYHVCEPMAGDDPAYLARLLRHLGTSGFLATQAPNVRERSVDFRNWSTFARIPLVLPPTDEQRSIVNFLDRETADIDTLIDEQQRLIEMLRERRWSVVERSVALLDWNTPLKAVAVLVQTGPFGSQLKSDEYEDGGTPIINPSHIVAGEVVPDPRVAVGAAKAEQLARHALEEGDLVAARRGELGRCAVVGAPAVGFLCGTGSALIRFNRAFIEPAFGAIVFSSRRNRDALALASVGSTMDNLNSDIIGSLRVPVPTLEEQRGLVAEISDATAKIDTLIEETEQFIELSRERRLAVISAAMTGQIDVPGVV
ncbi:restriction endonuclease subunit S [Streptomyces sp. WMMC1477]|uniref:restriction endonuclease subunit S n=1 Tax=Streptomyces sp. WMMC1477 TaxID=3015155 RepID=UPI0022B749E9|nr:restriction endonuclease subunit S [Streptomyces sp. WMMC1477]MCZ7431729.1 restriction endonuclease subunit S [Streptomyces sp. WMMC1477]